MQNILLFSKQVSVGQIVLVKYPLLLSYGQIITLQRICIDQWSSMLGVTKEGVRAGQGLTGIPSGKFPYEGKLHIHIIAHSSDQLNSH